MKPIINSVEELYSRKEGTGEVVLDEMASILRKTRIIAVSDMATLMNVSAHQLNMAVGMLTGMTVRSIINGWRLLQARDMLRQGRMAQMRDGLRSLGSAEAIDGFKQNTEATERTKRRDAVARAVATAGTSNDRVKRLDAVARACGWRSYRVMLKVARRYRFKLE